MSKSYRIRTEPGVDKTLNVQIEQDFEYLEILSLKLLQSEIYTRQCSDYGVIIGRVSVNNGFGIPNAKVSVFIPLESEDEENPIISELYPYKTLNDVNEDGYRYNLLPYVQSHSGHQPTGTFFDREDVLTNLTLIEVFDKYYKYTATTNDSGDFMIFGVPVGSHQIVMDVDLSDIGEFSLSPQDLVRMGIATEQEVAGTNFKVGENLRALPQILNINKTIQVEPLWGQEDLCNIGINRTDFDLSNELNLEIRPTSVFMGSIVSTADGDVVKRNCKSKNKAGSLCSLVTGPGEILAIRQTIGQDGLGRPILETVDLESGGVVIDDNGTWLIDVPMNLDYVTTNEFGEQVISVDPNVGIPTSGKYRFKVKWSQSPSLSEPIKRGYFLVPNVKEYGWTNTTSDPANQPIGSSSRDDFDKSYAFSLDWDDYVNIQDSIDCKDTFYPMKYNKVYTVSQLVDQYRRGYAPNKFIGIKNILNDECESKVNKFPSNDAVFRFDLLYFLFWIMLFLFMPIFFVLIPLVHILWAVLKILAIIVCIIIIPLIFIISIICNIVKAILSILTILPFGIGRMFRRIRNGIDCPKPDDGVKICEELLAFPDKLKNIKIPNLSYPECSFCDCGEEGDNLPQDDEYSDDVNSVVGQDTVVEGLSLLSVFQLSGNYINRRDLSPDPSNGTPGVYTQDLIYQTIFAGETFGSEDSGTLTSATRIPEMLTSVTNDEDPTNTPTDPDAPENSYFTSSLTLYERLNLFNNKSKYFDKDTIGNPGGGVNRIKVAFEPTLNAGKFHYDNVIAVVCNGTAETSLSSGTIVSFQDEGFSSDTNIDVNSSTILNQYGTYSITGTTINNGSVGSPAQVTVSYANPNNNNVDIDVTYDVVQDETIDPPYARFPMDIEYCQVIENMSYDDYMLLLNNGTVTSADWDNINSFGKRILNNKMSFYRVTNPITNFNPPGPGSSNCPPALYWSVQNREFNPIEYFSDYGTQRIVFMVRGVDPNSTRVNVEYDLSRLFGYDFGNPSTIVTGEFKMNHPINGNWENHSHNVSSNLTSDIYYDSFHFVPSQGSGPFDFSSFNTNLHTYYSNTDVNNLGFTPDNLSTTPSLGSVTSSADNVLRVNGNWASSPLFYTQGARGSNGFISEWKVLTTETIPCFGPPFFGVIPRRTGQIPIGPNWLDRNRGYYLNEIIEGGSLFYQRVNITDGANTTPNELINHYYSSKYSDTLSLNINLTSTDNKKIVMRSDRLPTSTVTQDNLNNSFALHSNSNFLIVTYNDSGVAQVQNINGGGSTALNQGADEDYTDSENSDQPEVLTEVINSFNCGSMAPLGCYYDNNNELMIRDKSDDCWGFGGGRNKMDGGCYILITKPIISLINGRDFLVVIEWKNRVQTIFGACRNVFSHLFTNNWINGTLYAFTFKNDVFYDSLNQPESNICKDVIVLHSPTNNLYYRSSPWDNVNQNFIGHDANDGYGGNFRYLKYPTTIMDLGPRTDYIQEIVMSDDYDGYVVTKLDSTTYGDVSELLNMLIVTRLANMNFLTQVSSLGILTFFSRTKLMVDGDYAQMNSINSELGVAPFESTNYAWTSPGQDPIFYDSGSINETLFGVFFSSDTQTRDFISPKRTIINPTLTVTDTCAFSNFDVFSQEVPFYQWNIKSSPYIFGTQKNDWYTNPISNGGYFTHKYQSLDRLEPSSRYFRTNGSPQTRFDKGYIYAVNGNTQDDLSADTADWDLNSNPSTSITTGAPFHFYFGLNKGKSAFDRFRQKWINQEIIID